MEPHRAVLPGTVHEMLFRAIPVPARHAAIRLVHAAAVEAVAADVDHGIGADAAPRGAGGEVPARPGPGHPTAGVQRADLGVGERAVPERGIVDLAVVQGDDVRIGGRAITEPGDDHR